MPAVKGMERRQDTRVEILIRDGGGVTYKLVFASAGAFVLEPFPRRIAQEQFHDPRGIGRLILAHRDGVMVPFGQNELKMAETLQRLTEAGGFPQLVTDWSPDYLKGSDEEGGPAAFCLPFDYRGSGFISAVTSVARGVCAEIGAEVLDAVTTQHTWVYDGSGYVDIAMLELSRC